MLTTWLSSLCSSWVPGFLQPPPDDGIPEYTRDEISAAIRNADGVGFALDAFRSRVKEEFPHRVDALAVADEFEQILREQHGGYTPYEFLHDWKFGVLGDLSSREDRKTMGKVCGRWTNRDEVDREFWVVRPSSIKRWHKMVVTERRISDAVAFMQRWLRDQRSQENRPQV